MQICGGVTYKVTYPSSDLSKQSLAAETFCVLEDYSIPSPFSPISQEELDELSIQSDDSMKEPTSPLGTALSRRKHSKTRVEDAEANYWNLPMSQEELDGYTIGCEWKERFPSSPEASRLRIRKNMMFSKKINKCDPLQTIAIDGGACGNYVAEEADNFQGEESPMSKALRRKTMNASLGEEAQKDDGGEEGWKSCYISESEILRRKKHMAVQKTNLSFFGEGQLFAMTDETEAQDGSESPMSKALRRKAMLKNEQENRRGEASFDFRSGKFERNMEGGETGVLAECALPPPLSPNNVEQPSTSLLRRKKQNQLAGGYVRSAER